MGLVPLKTNCTTDKEIWVRMHSAILVIVAVILLARKLIAVRTRLNKKYVTTLKETQRCVLKVVSSFVQLALDCAQVLRRSNWDVVRAQLANILRPLLRAHATTAQQDLLNLKRERYSVSQRANQNSNMDDE